MSLLLAAGFPIVFLAVSIVIDALIYLQFKWAKLVGCFRDSAIANIVSLAIIALLWNLLQGIESVLLILLIAWIISVLVEGFVLILLRRGSAPQSYMVALGSNVSSFIFALAYVLSFVLG